MTLLTPTILFPEAKFSIHQRMRSGFDIPVPLFHRRNDNRGTWLYPADPNFPDAAHFIYYRHDGDFRSDGFGGATLTFATPEGEVSLQGPWNSNANSLYAATGVDLRDCHLTRGIIALGREYSGVGAATYRDVLHLDSDWTRGRFSRIEDLAKDLSASLNCEIYYAVISRGGGCSSYVRPLRLSRTIQEPNRG